MSMSLEWKAYQTYADGSVISWDADPKVSDANSETTTPYSVTDVVNDLSAKPAALNGTPLWLGIASVALALVGIVIGLRRK